MSRVGRQNLGRILGANAGQTELLPRRFLVEQIERSPRGAGPGWVLFDAMDGSSLHPVLEDEELARAAAACLDGEMHRLGALVRAPRPPGSDPEDLLELRAYASLLPSWLLSVLADDLRTWSAICRELLWELWRLRLQRIVRPDLRDALGHATMASARQAALVYATVVERRAAEVRQLARRLAKRRVLPGPHGATSDARQVAGPASGAARAGARRRLGRSRRMGARPPD